MAVPPFRALLPSPQAGATAQGQRKLQCPDLKPRRLRRPFTVEGTFPKCFHPPASIYKCTLSTGWEGAGEQGTFPKGQAKAVAELVRQSEKQSREEDRETGGGRRHGKENKGGWKAKSLFLIVF